MAKKQSQEIVSAAADNTKVLKQTKNIIKLVVSGVRIAGEERKVKFVAKNKRGGVVICRTKGQPPIRVRSSLMEGREVYDASVRGQDGVVAKTPSQAFAQGVRQFWA